MGDDSVKKNKAEALALRPIKWSVAAIALALITSLALESAVSSVYGLQARYGAIIASQEAQLAAVAMSASRSKSAEKPLTGTAKESNRIIVKYKTDNLPPGLAIAAEKTNLERAQGLMKKFTISGIEADVYEVAEDDSAQEVVDRLLATKSDMIEYAEVDMIVPPAIVPNDPLYGSQWHHTIMESSLAWDASQGESVIVAVLDSGIDADHPDLVANLIPGWNTYSNNSDTSESGSSHGTKVSGTVAAASNNGLGVAGMASQAKHMPVRTTDASGNAYYSSIASGITYAANNGARVVNVSYGGNTCNNSTMNSAAQYLRSKGGVLVIAAGNTGADNAMPANNLLTCVSATGSNDARPSWSSWGASVDLAAPGVGIYTTTNGGGYAGQSGTSFSAPLVAAVYALVFSANPSLTPTQADNILFSTADDIGVSGWDMYYGYGRVNAAQAVAAALAASGTRDTVAPSVPSNLRTTSLSSNSVSLAWNASTDDNSGVAGYSIYGNGVKIATVAGTSYTNSGLTPNMPYAYTVRAEDVQGNVSVDSTKLTVTTPDLPFGIVSYSVPVKTNTGATITATLTKPGSVTVKYGVTSTNLNLSATSLATSTAQHTVSLTALTAATTYYYQVVATDGTSTLTSPISSFKTSKGGGGGGGGKPNR